MISISLILVPYSKLKMIYNHFTGKPFEIIK